MQSFHGIQPVFDEDNLVSHTGLVPVLALAERAGLSELVREHSSVPSASRDVKARTVIAGMLAMASSWACEIFPSATAAPKFARP